MGWPCYCSVWVLFPRFVLFDISVSAWVELVCLGFEFLWTLICLRFGVSDRWVFRVWVLILSLWIVVAVLICFGVRVLIDCWIYSETPFVGFVAVLFAALRRRLVYV